MVPPVSKLRGAVDCTYGASEAQPPDGGGDDSVASSAPVRSAPTTVFTVAGDRDLSGADHGNLSNSASRSLVFEWRLHSELGTVGFSDSLLQALASVACAAVGGLQQCRTRTPLVAKDVLPSSYSSDPARGADDMNVRFLATIRDCSEATVSFPDFDQCLITLGKTRNPLRLSDLLTVRPYQKELLNICCSDLQSVPLLPLPDSETASIAADSWTHILIVTTWCRLTR